MGSEGFDLRHSSLQAIADRSSIRGGSAGAIRVMKQVTVNLPPGLIACGQVTPELCGTPPASRPTAYNTAVIYWYIDHETN